MNDREPQGQALQRRSYELSILNDVARALNASVDLPALLARNLEMPEIDSIEAIRHLRAADPDVQVVVP
jgi:DNA-binding NarL/FixJ family response regulator